MIAKDDTGEFSRARIYETRNGYASTRVTTSLHSRLAPSPRGELGHSSFSSESFFVASIAAGQLAPSWQAYLMQNKKQYNSRKFVVENLVVTAHGEIRADAIAAHHGPTAQAPPLNKIIRDR